MERNEDENGCSAGKNPREYQKNIKMRKDLFLLYVDGSTTGRQDGKTDEKVSLRQLSDK